MLLRFRINYRNILLSEAGESESVPVKLKTGEYRYVRWRGFIGVEAAKQSQGTPVKLQMTAYAVNDLAFDWVELQPGEHIQGCLAADGVSAVLDSHGFPRVVL